MGRSQRITALIASLLVATLFVSACAHVDEKRQAGTTRIYEPEHSHITLLGLTLGVSTMADARKVLGPAEVAAGKYRHDPHTMCYGAADPSDPAKLTVRTDFFGDWDKLTGFEISGAAGGGCTESALVCSGLSTQSGLRLGLTRAQVEAILGRPGETRGEVDKYLYLTERELTDEQREKIDEFSLVSLDYDVITVIIEVEYKDDRVVRLGISRSESV